MSNQEVTKTMTPEVQEEIGVVHNDQEQGANQDSEALEEVVGVVHNEPPERSDQGTAPVPQEIGVTKNEADGSGEPAKPEIGRIRNEPPARP